MYTQQDEKRLYELAKHLLQDTTGNTELTITNLREVILYADWKYYVQSEPVLADAEYDALRRRNSAIEERFPLLIRPDSPTHRVGAKASAKFAITE